MQHEVCSSRQGSTTAMVSTSSSKRRPVPCRRVRSTCILSQAKAEKANARAFSAAPMMKQSATELPRSKDKKLPELKTPIKREPRRKYSRSPSIGAATDPVKECAVPTSTKENSAEKVEDTGDKHQYVKQRPPIKPPAPPLEASGEGMRARCPVLWRGSHTTRP